MCDTCVGARKALERRSFSLAPDGVGDDICSSCWDLVHQERCPCTDGRTSIVDRGLVGSYRADHEQLGFGISLGFGDGVSRHRAGFYQAGRGDPACQAVRAELPAEDHIDSRKDCLEQGARYLSGTLRE